MFDFLDNLLLYSAIFCGVSIALVAITIYFVYRRLSNMTEPNIEQIKAEFEQLKANNPNATPEKIVRRVIHRQAMKAGAVGAVTSLGGFYTLPIALPVDILFSMRIQTTLVDFIATIHGHENTNDIESRVRQYLITSGGLAVTERTSRMAMKFALRMMGKSFAKLIPFVGAFIGFAVNYFIAQATGNLALQWYSGKVPGKNMIQQVQTQLPQQKDNQT